MGLLRGCLLLLCTSMFCVRLSVAAPCLGEQSAQKSYSVYLIPWLSATMLYHDWAPFLTRLGKESSLRFDLHIPADPADFTEFEQTIQAGLRAANTAASAA